MIDPETKKLIDSLTDRIKKLEDFRFAEHRHTGLDSLKANFKNLNTITYIETTIDPGSLVDGAGSTHSVTIEGVNLSDFVLISAPYDLQDMTVTAYVQAEDTVEIRIQNESGGTKDLASGDWRIIVIKNFI